MKIRHILLIGLLCAACVPRFSHAQPAGNPAGTAGRGKWTVVLSNTYSEQKLENLSALNRRILMKSSWGVSPWLDLYVTGGVVNLEMKQDSAGIRDYKDEKYRFALGGGARISLLSLKKRGFGVWGGARFLMFSSSGSFIEPIESFSRRYDLDYTWKELSGFASCGVRAGMFTLYGGAAFWALDRDDIKKQYLVSQSSSTFVGSEDGEYNSGIKAGGLFGVEFRLARNFVISAEARYFSADDFIIIAGIGQTGIAAWNTMPSDE